MATVLVPKEIPPNVVTMDSEEPIVYSAEAVRLVHGAGKRWLLDQHIAHPIAKEV